jgi:hypothetical protein
MPPMGLPLLPITGSKEITTNCESESFLGQHRCKAAPDKGVKIFLRRIDEMVLCPVLYKDGSDNE